MLMYISRLNKLCSYYDQKHDSFGCLRVINEDRVEPKSGFGTHAHREFEIFSYVVSGELEQYVLLFLSIFPSHSLHRSTPYFLSYSKDSMNNTELLHRGDLQLTSAGSPGISHSEKCHGSQPVHFLQIWTLPWKAGLPAKYFTRHFTDEEKKAKWCRVVSRVGAEGVKSRTKRHPNRHPLHLTQKPEPRLWGLLRWT